VKITLMRAWPDRHELLGLEVAESATVADALREAGWEVAPDASVGVWGKAHSLTRALREGDRVELYRPLQADPKTARRKRAAR
jgi:uncharacterized protein